MKENVTQASSLTGNAGLKPARSLQAKSLPLRNQARGLSYAAKPELPIERCAALYRADGRNFLDVVADHLATGIVIDNQECFAMGKAVELEEGGRLAWMVTAAAGDLFLIVRAMPWYLPFVAFYRRRRIYKTDPSNKCGRLRVYPTRRFIELTNWRLNDFQIANSLSHSVVN